MIHKIINILDRHLYKRITKNVFALGSLDSEYFWKELFEDNPIVDKLFESPFSKPFVNYIDYLSFIIIPIVLVFLFFTTKFWEYLCFLVMLQGCLYFLLDGIYVLYAFPRSRLIMSLQLFQDLRTTMMRPSLIEKSVQLVTMITFLRNYTIITFLLYGMLIFKVGSIAQWIRFDFYIYLSIFGWLFLMSFPVIYISSVAMFMLSKDKMDFRYGSFGYLLSYYKTRLWYFFWNRYTLGFIITPISLFLLFSPRDQYFPLLIIVLLLLGIVIGLPIFISMITSNAFLIKYYRKANDRFSGVGEIDHQPNALPANPSK